LHITLIIGTFDLPDPRDCSLMQTCYFLDISSKGADAPTLDSGQACCHRAYRAKEADTRYWPRPAGHTCCISNSAVSRQHLVLATEAAKLRSCTSWQQTSETWAMASLRLCLSSKRAERKSVLRRDEPYLWPRPWLPRTALAPSTHRSHNGDAQVEPLCFPPRLPPPVSTSATLRENMCLDGVPFSSDSISTSMPD
jgi:hypothetical protein